MNTPIDSNDDTAEVQAVMGDYFAALLRESAEAPAQPAVVEALDVTCRSDSRRTGGCRGNFTADRIHR